MRLLIGVALVVVLLQVVAASTTVSQAEAEAMVGAEATSEVEIRVGMSVEMEMDSLAGVYGLPEQKQPHVHLPAFGSKAYNQARNFDKTITSSAQEKWGCCRVCDDLNELVPKIPPEKEYGLSVRDKRRHVAPERGFDDWNSPMISCCPTCLYPPKNDPELSRVPTEQGDMDTEMSIYSRGDGPTDEDAVGGAVVNERAGQFAKADQPNVVKPSAEFIAGFRERAQKRVAKKQAEAEFRRASKHGTPSEKKAAAEKLLEFGFVEQSASTTTTTTATTTTDSGIEMIEPQYIDSDADSAADANTATKTEPGSEMRYADVDADADADLEAVALADAEAEAAAAVAADAAAEADAEAEKFRLGKFLKKAGKKSGQIC